MEDFYIDTREELLVLRGKLEDVKDIAGSLRSDPSWRVSILSDQLFRLDAVSNFF